MNKDKKPFTYTLGGAGSVLSQSVLTIFCSNNSIVYITCQFVFSEKGILDLNQIKSPRMKKRLQANLRGDEDPKNEISPRPTSSLAAADPLSVTDLLPDPYGNHLTSTLDSNDPSLDPMIQDLVRGPSPTNVTYQIPPPPPKTIAALENLSLGLPPPPQQQQQESSARPFPVKTTPVPYNPRYNSFEAAVDDQLAGLCSSLKLDSNNNSSAYSYPYNVS